MSKPFLIINHHRSGSNFLCRVIKENKKVRCLNEPLSMHMDFFKKHDLEIMDKARLVSKLDVNESAYLQRLKIYLDETPTITGFKETGLFGKMDWVFQYFEGIKIIYLVRNPLAVVNSCLRDDMWKQWNYEVVINNYCNSSNIITSPFELCVKSWKIRYNLFETEMRKKDYLVVRLEDLVFEPKSTLYKVMNYIGSDVTKQQVELINNSYLSERGKNYSIYRNKEKILNDWKRTLGEEQIEYIKRELSFEMQKLGYI